jgi:hypothetical protein
MKKAALQDHPVPVRFKLAALWTSVMFCYVYGDYFEFYVPGKVQDMLAGDNILDTPLKLWGGAVLLAIPALMVFLSLVLKPIAAKWLNVVFGIFYTGVMLLIAVTSIAPWYTFYVFFAVLESILTGLAVWYAWTWERELEAG